MGVKIRKVEIEIDVIHTEMPGDNGPRDHAVIYIAPVVMTAQPTHPDLILIRRFIQALRDTKPIVRM